VKILIRLLVVAIGLAIVLALVQHSGSFLVVQRLDKADVIVVLGGDLNDRRYWKGIELLQSGYGQELLVDALDQTTIFGHTHADWAQRFLRRPTLAS
jgi:polysaccharide pyruvyl transferase WcaK-like protein